MIKYSKIILENGLVVINHHDALSKISMFNLMYNAGSKHEYSDKTGVAHFLEHMMFEGTSKNKSFDKVLASSGGDSNAFTSPDVTNYYQSLPSTCLETAFALESDRMFSLSLDEESFSIQKKVVIEEFKQRYLTQPYGDVWHVLRDFCYSNSSYKWPTIGRSVSEIGLLSSYDLRDFYNQYYVPNNAHLVVGGCHSDNEVFDLANRYFSPLKGRNVPSLNFREPTWEGRSLLEVEREVPQDMIYIAFQAQSRCKDDFIPTSVMVDMLGHGKSSFLYKEAVLKKKVLNSVSMYHTTAFEDSLIVLSGRLSKGVCFSDAENELIAILNLFGDQDTLEHELLKVKNQEVSSHAFEMVELQSRVLSLAYSSVFGNVEEVNIEQEKIEKVIVSDVISAHQEYINTKNYKVIYYKAV